MDIDIPDIRHRLPRPRLVVYAGAVLLVIALIVTGMAFVTIGEGYVGVEKHKGAVTGEVFEPDWHFINPATKSVEKIETRPIVDNHKEIYAITQDGQDVWVDVTVRYRVYPDNAALFHSEYNNHEQAQARVIEPTVRSTLRDEVGDASARDIITRSERLALQAAIEESLSENVDGTGLSIEAVQIRNVNLNDQYAEALENVEIEETHAEQRLIRAEAIAEANDIRDRSLTDEILMEMYLESIDESTTVILATDGDGTPIILSVDDANEAGFDIDVDDEPMVETNEEEASEDDDE